MPATPMALPTLIGRRAGLAAVQAKLTVGEPNDPYEQEADRVAEQVMRMPEPEQTGTATKQPTHGPLDRELLQAEGLPGTTPLISPSLERQLAASQAKGNPLPQATRGFMESRFGRDFSRVRIHADREAGEASKALEAKAFTHGQDVYFGAGSFEPETSEGKQLLAHELTHVVQQQQISMIHRAMEGNTAAFIELSSWRTDDLIREYIMQPESSSEYKEHLLNLICNRLRNRSSTDELPEYESLLLNESTRTTPEVEQLLDLIDKIKKLQKQRESASEKAIYESFYIESALEAQASKQKSSAAMEQLKRQLAWRKDLLFTSRPTQKWVILHRGLIEDLRIRYESSNSAETIKEIADHLHTQQQLLAWALQQDMEAILIRQQEISVDLRGEQTSTFPEAQTDQTDSGIRRSLKQECLLLESELKAAKEELNLLRGIFNQKRWEAISKTYTSRKLNNADCMKALYIGLGAMFSPAESKSIQKTVNKESLQYHTKKFGKPEPNAPRIQTRNVDRIMETLKREGKAGDKVTTTFNQKRGEYMPSIRQLVVAQVRGDQPGRYLFGLSLHEAYHTVAIAVEVLINGTIKIYWLDQTIKSGFSSENDVSTEKAMQNKINSFPEPSYGYRKSTIWPLIAPEPITPPERLVWEEDKNYNAEDFDFILSTQCILDPK
ncbi:MAG: DUF4157 domain-containing protein [Cyanobacteriota bacterium]